MAVIGGLLTAALSAGSQLANYFINERNIERQNAYNSPAAQVSRLRAAGINPYAVTGQIAGNNQGITNRAEFDFGKSAQSGFSVYNDLVRTEMSKAQNDIYLEKLREQVRALRNNNRLFEDSYNYRLESLNYASQKAFFDMLYASGKLDRQNYDNVIAYITSEFTKYQAGLYTDLFGSAVWTNTDEDGYTIEEPRIPMRDIYNSKWSQSVYDMQFKRDTLNYKIEYERLKNLKTEADYKNAVVDYLRNAIAYRYERSMNMPWNTRDPWLHVLAPVLDAVSNAIGGGSWAEIWENLPANIDF